MSATLKIPRSKAEARAIQRVAWPDAWAVDLKLKVDGRPFSTEGREYISQVIRDNSDRIVAKKAAQMAFTILCLIRSFHWIVQRRWHHMYLLPKKEGIVPFVQSRVDTIIDSNENLKTLFKSVDNRLHKQTTDDIKFLFRGTNIESELQEVPIDVEVWDERDRMNEQFLPDAMRRMDGSNVKKLIQISTPTAIGFGVDADDLWGDSDQHEWEVPCLHCNRYQVITFEENVHLGDDHYTCELYCKFCKREITLDDRRLMNGLGRWVPQNLNGHQRGYHISQFNSPSQPLPSIMEDYYKGQKDAKKLRTFHNQSLGQAFSAKGDKFTVELLDSCIGHGHRLGGIPPGRIVIGIDVGDFIHVKASYMKGEKRIAWQYHIFREWSDVDNFLASVGQFMCVIDADPERKQARDLSIKYPGMVWLGFSFDRPQTASIAEFSRVVYGEAGKVVIDKPMAMDSVIGSYLGGNTILPMDARELGEEMPTKPYNGLYHQMIQCVRIQEEDAKGNTVTRWVKNKNADHWHHADMFEFVATMRDPVLRVPTNLGDALRKAGSPIA